MANSLEPLNLEGILEVYETIVDEDFIYIIRPFCSKGNLIEALNKSNTRLLTEIELRGPAKRLCKALKSIHESNYLHGDIRPQSIFIHKSEQAASKLRTVFGDFERCCPIDVQARQSEHTETD